MSLSEDLEVSLLGSNTNMHLYTNLLFLLSEMSSAYLLWPEEPPLIRNSDSKPAVQAQASTQR